MVSRRHWIILGMAGGFGCLAFLAVVIVVLAGICVQLFVREDFNRARRIESSSKRKASPAS